MRLAGPAARVRILLDAGDPRNVHVRAIHSLHLVVHALGAYTACIVTPTQYTIRRVPPRLDRELRRKAREERLSLNEMALRAIERGLGLAEEEPRHHDLDDLAGTWVDDPEFDQAIKAMDQVDPELWR